MHHLTHLMKRPKKLRKEFTIKNPPDFEGISKEHPLPILSHVESNESSVVNCHDLICRQSLIGFHRRGSTMIQATNPLVVQQPSFYLNLYFNL